MLTLIKFVAMSIASSCFVSDAAAIPPLSDVRTDSQNGVPVSFDLTQSTPLNSVLVRDSLAHSPFSSKQATGYALIGGQVVNPGSPGNALIQGAHPLTEGINHWRFVGVAGSFGCGASDLDRFGSGWKLNGLYLTSNGNLAGRGALKVGYAKQIPTNPTIDWFLEVSGNQIDIYININDIPQGHAFHLTFPEQSAIQNLRPMLTFSETSQKAQVAFLQFDAVPLNAQSAQLYLRRPALTLRYTTWALEENPRVTFLVTDGKAMLKVGNTMSVPADFLADGSITVKASPISTLMMLPEPLRKVEAQMTEMITTMDSWQLKHETLYIKSAIGLTKWHPQVESDPVLENPFVTK